MNIHPETKNPLPVVNTHQAIALFAATDTGLGQAFISNAPLAFNIETPSSMPSFPIANATRLMMKNMFVNDSKMSNDFLMGKQYAIDAFEHNLTQRHELSLQAQHGLYQKTKMPTLEESRMEFDKANRGNMQELERENEEWLNRHTTFNAPKPPKPRM